jgi:tetratricopeptide (TPR) repeat protein
VAGFKPRAGEASAVAQFAVQAKDFTAAAEFFEHALVDEPAGKRSVLLDWGLALLVADRFKEAAAVLRRGAEDPDLAEQRPAFDYFLAGALALSDETDVALAAARRAAAARPKSAQFAARVAWVLNHADRRNEARDEYVKLVGRFEEDEATLDDEQTRETLRDARQSLSNLDAQRREMPAAEEWLEQVLDEFPADAGTLNDLGYLWADQGRHLPRAAAMIERAVASEPENPAFLDSLGWVNFRLGKLEPAAAALEKAVALDASRRADRRADGVLLDHLGDVYHRQGRTEQAKTVWQQALEAFKNQPEKAESVRKKLNAEM